MNKEQLQICIEALACYIACSEDTTEGWPEDLAERVHQKIELAHETCAMLEEQLRKAE